MKRRATMMAAVVAVLAAGPFGAAAEGDVEGLSWMQGRWTGEKDGVTSEEHWTDAAGGAMLGLHRDLKGGRMVSWEFLRIGTTAAGTFYFASPRSKPPTPVQARRAGGPARRLREQAARLPAADPLLAGRQGSPPRAHRGAAGRDDGLGGVGLDEGPLTARRGQGRPGP